MDASAARIWAAVECARKVGRPSREPLVLAGRADEAGRCCVPGGRLSRRTRPVTDVDAPVAFAFLMEGDR